MVSSYVARSLRNWSYDVNRWQHHVHHAKCTSLHERGTYLQILTVSKQKESRRVDFFYHIFTLV